MINFKYLKTYKDFLNESFLGKDMPEALEQIASYLNKKIGHLYNLPGIMLIKRKGKELAGVVYIDMSGRGIRINWLKGKSSSIHSVDFYGSGLLKPDYTLEINGESIAKILPLIVKLYKNPSEGYKYVNTVSEKEDSDDERSSKVRYSKSADEEDVDDSIEKLNDKLDKIEYADPKTVDDDLKGYIQMVVSGLQPALIICGGPGMSKSFTVEKVLADNDLKKIEPIEFPENIPPKELRDMGIDLDAETDGDWVQIKGTSTAFGLYMNLFKYRDKIVVFDDCDKAFQDKESINILKGALDTGDKRVISWISKATASAGSLAPPRFEFKGKVIFITNLYFNQIDSAIRSRSMITDVTIRAKDILLKIKSLLPNIKPNLLTMKSKEEAYEYLAEADRLGKNIEISFRSLIIIAKVIQSGLPNYKSMVEQQIKNFRT